MAFNLSDIILPSTSAILGSRLGRSVAIANNTPNTSIVAGGPNYNEYQGCIRMFCYNTNTSSMENFDVYGTTGSNFGYDVARYKWD